MKTIRWLAFLVEPSTGLRVVVIYHLSRAQSTFSQTDFDLFSLMADSCRVGIIISMFTRARSENIHHYIFTNNLLQ